MFTFNQNPRSLDLQIFKNPKLEVSWSSKISKTWKERLLTRGMSQCGVAIYIKKYLRQKKNDANSNISPCKILIFKKGPLKETKILQDVITLVTNLKFQHKPKTSSFKNPHIKIDLLTRGQNHHLSYYTLYDESKHNILALVVGKANKVKESHTRSQYLLHPQPGLE